MENGYGMAAGALVCGEVALCSFVQQWRMRENEVTEGRDVCWSCNSVLVAVVVTTLMYAGNSVSVC